LWVHTSSSCNPGALGETDVPYSPGLAVPAGDALCSNANDKIVVLFGGDNAGPVTFDDTWTWGSG
jgi:hypothetical protein